VKTYSGTEVAWKRFHLRQPPGTRRHEANQRAHARLEVVEEDNVITSANVATGNGAMVLSVPVDTSLRLRSLSGTIKVDGVHGEVDVHTANATSH